MKKPFLGVAYYPEDWPESEIEKDAAGMKAAGITVARIAEFAWKKTEPEKGRYDFSWLHKVVDTLYDHGIAVVMGTPTATPPFWFIREYPDATRVRPDGSRESHGGRRHCCSNHPGYVSESARIVDALAREFGNDKNVIGWQIDNEIYEWGDGCCCENCVKAFRENLKEKYGTIDEVNERWNLNVFSQAYDSFDDVPPAVNAWHNPHLIYEWIVFHQESHIRFVKMQADILRKYVRVPIGTDMMPVNGVDYEKINENLDVVMFNHYNEEETLGDVTFWFDYLRTLKKAPFWNTETSTSWNGSSDIGQIMKPEGFCRVNSWLPVAFGGEANMYWLWRQHRAGQELNHGALLYANGRPFHILPEVQRTAAEFEKASDFIENTAVATETAMLFTSKNWNLFECQKIVRGNNYGRSVTRDFHAPVAAAGLRPDVIGAKKDISRYKLIFAPLMMTLEDGDLASRMENWVKDGGVLVAGPMCDIRDGVGAHYTDGDTGIPERLTGCELTYTIPDEPRVLTCAWADGTELKARSWFELYTPCDGARTLAAVTGGHTSVNGKAVILDKQVGRGRIILLGTFLSENDMKKLASYAARQAGVVPVAVSGGVAAVPREGENRRGLILIEYANKGGECVLEKPMRDILGGGTYEGAVKLAPYEMLILEEI